jgi:putative flippase GtrA
MERLLVVLGENIKRGIDFFYTPFRNLCSPEFFRYGVTGGANLVFDWVVYFLIYNFVLAHRMVDLSFVKISSHVATLAFKMPIVLLSGFLLQKYVTFSHSYLRGRVQLIRYLIVFLLNLIISYLGIKLLVEKFHWYPTPSNIIMSLITVFVSYFSQKYFTFRGSFS